MQLTSLSLALTRAGFLSFSPASLFANSEPGVWYDPSDFSTMFQDRAGTTPVTAVEQPVGLILDKSKGLVLGPELVDTANSASAWTPYGSNTVTDDDSAVKITFVGGTDSAFGAFANLNAAGVLSQNLTANSWYEISFLARVNSGSSIDFGIRNGSTTPSIATVNVAGTSYTAHKLRFLTATPLIFSPNFSLNGTFNSGEAIWLRNISVRKLPGNHAFQTTSTSRPVLSARYNLLESTEQFSALRWTRANTSVAVSATTAPNGTLSAAKLSASATTATHALAQGVTLSSGIAHKFSCYLKAGEETTAALWQNVNGGTIFDLVAGTVVSGLAQATIESVGDGWFLCSVPYTPSSTSGLVQIYPRTTASYTGDGTSGIYIWGASLVPANQADLPYQRVNTATDYDADPSKFKPYLRFDGVDDWLVTPTITPGTDKAQVFAGVRKLSDATQYQVVVESSTMYNTNNGALLLSSSWNAAQYAAGSRGTSFTNCITGGFSAPRTNVLTLVSSISEDVLLISVNGTQAAISTADQGTGNFLEYPLYIGRRGGTTLPFNGHLYGLIVRFGSNLPAATIASTESWVNGKTGAY